MTTAHTNCLLPNSYSQLAIEFIFFVPPLPKVLDSSTSTIIKDLSGISLSLTLTLKDQPLLSFKS